MSPLVLALSACGGRATEIPEGAVPGGGAGGVSFGGQPSMSAGRGGQGFGGGSAGYAGRASGGTSYVDPGCPDEPPPPAQIRCDVASQTGCPDGFGCYPYVDHPSGQGCGAQTFGTHCAFAGTGVQGEGCGSGTDGCAPGFICVVGGHAGRRCAKLCTFQGPDECPAGLLCGDTDVRGYGVCG